MKSSTRIAVLAGLGLLLIVGSWLVIRQRQQAPTVSGGDSTGASGRSGQPVPEINRPSAPGSPSVTTSPTGTVKTASRLITPLTAEEKAAWAKLDPAAKKAKVAEVLQELGRLYGPAGVLSWDDAKALIAGREQAEEELVNRLASLGSGGARLLSESYPPGTGTREQLLIIRALGRIEDAEAADVLQAMLTAEKDFSLRKEMVLALGKRTDSASAAAVANILVVEPDSQVRYAAAQAISGNTQWQPLITQQIYNDPSPDVQKRLIRSLGLSKTDAALNALSGVAHSQMELSVRQTAIQEMARSFGEKSLDVLSGLVTDSDPAIRENAVVALATIHNEQAAALVKQVAASDPSAAIRARAQMSIPAK